MDEVVRMGVGVWMEGERDELQEHEAEAIDIFPRDEATNLCWRCETT